MHTPSKNDVTLQSEQLTGLGEENFFRHLWIPDLLEVGLVKETTLFSLQERLRETEKRILTSRMFELSIFEDIVLEYFEKIDEGTEFQKTFLFVPIIITRKFIERPIMSHLKSYGTSSKWN